MKKLHFVLAIACIALFSLSATAQTRVPDAKFRQALIDLGIVTGFEGEIATGSMISEVTALDIPAKNISDLTGIEDFVNLLYLDCSNNNLQTLDLSHNTNLTDLDCYWNLITTLDLSHNTNLINLKYAHNQLPSLDLTANLLLEELLCSENQIVSLNVSHLTALKNLDCRYNLLTTLDVSQNTGLERLSVNNNELTSLNLSNNVNLKEVYCENNQLVNLDLSHNSALTYVWCRNNPLVTLDIRNDNNVAIIQLWATGNPSLTCIYVNDKTISRHGWDKPATAQYANDESECEAPVSVTSISEAPIAIYPNPSNGIVHLDLQGKRIQNLKVVDVTGKIIAEKSRVNSTETVDLSNFSNGLYLVILQSENGTQSFKVVKE